MTRTVPNLDWNDDAERERQYAEKSFLYAAMALAALRSLGSTQVIYRDHEAIKKRTVEVVRFNK